MKNEVIFETINQFIENKGFGAISHVIFGHFHESNAIFLEELTIMNAGCWISYKRPSYIEIYLDGTSRVKNIDIFDSKP